MPRSRKYLALPHEAGAERSCANQFAHIVLLSKETIGEILARTDIGTFIGAYVQLRKRGRDLVGLCPFHGEKTPSFHVHPDRGFYKCFGCGESGDAIGFVQKLENLTFPDAARLLARRAGVELEAESSETTRIRGEKERIYAANAIAVAYFAERLRSAAGERARAYLERRAFAAETIDAFKLGFAPDGWDGLAGALKREGVDPALAIAAGLLKSSQSGRPYDLFRNRLMIPTYQVTGEAVAFGGRVFDDTEPKYLNTPSTPVYTKGQGLFALNLARRAARDRDALIVVEGYLDCIALHQAGFTNAVASLGTSFTSEQATELHKYAERIFVCFDADAAGGAATAKSIATLRAAGCTTYVVRLPAGDDPDSYVRARGADGFAAALDAATHLSGLQFVIDREIDRFRERSLPPVQAARAVDALLRAEAPPEERDRWLVYAAARLGLAPNDVRNAAFAADAANFAPRRPANLGSATRHLAPAAEPPQVEREILAALVDEPALVAEYAGRIGVDAFRDERYKHVYARLCAAAGDLVVAADVFAVFGDDRDAIELLVALQKPDRSSRRRFPDSPARRAHLDRVVEGLTESRLESRARELARRLDDAFTAGLPAPRDEKDEHARLVEDLERRRKKRLGAR